MHSTNTSVLDIPYEIGPRFRKIIQERVERLEADADADELALPTILHAGHDRRHRLLIQTQRCEALRLRIFLSKTCLRNGEEEIF